MAWFSRKANAHHAASDPEASHGALAAVTAASFDRDVLEASYDQPVAVDFWAPWCRPCVAMLPVLEAVSTQYGEKIRVVGVNTQEETELGARLQVLAIPLLLVFSRGEQVGVLHGAQPKRKVIELFDSVLAELDGSSTDS